MQDHILSEIYELLANSSDLTLRQLVDNKKAEMGVTSDLQLSRIVGIDKTTLDRILKGDTQKLDLLALIKLDEFLGIGINRLTQIYIASLKSEYIGEIESARRASYIIRNFDVSGLKKIGWIESADDFKAIEQKIVSFFKLDNLYEYDREIGSVMFSRSKASSHDKMREFWVRSAIHQFEKINNPNIYNADELKTLIPRIRAYTNNVEKGFLMVVQALYAAGVTVIVQSYLSKTQVMGGTFIINRKPCIVITDYNKTYASIWIALLHELHHVIYDFDTIASTSYHLSGENNLLLEEDADFSAQEILFSQDKMNYIKFMINSNVYVNEFAKKNNVHPSIIYLYYCIDQKKEGKNVFGLYRDYNPSSEKALQSIRTNPFNKQTIDEEIENIKRVFVNYI